MAFGRGEECPDDQRDDGDESDAAGGAVRVFDERGDGGVLLDNGAVAEGPVFSTACAGTGGANGGSPEDDGDVVGEDNPSEGLEGARGWGGGRCCCIRNLALLGYFGDTLGYFTTILRLGGTTHGRWDESRTDMKNLKTLSVVLASALICGAGVTVRAQDTAQQDVKDAGHDTANAARDTGHATKHETKKAYHKTKSGTHRAADKTKEGTHVAADRTKEGAQTGADRTKEAFSGRPSVTAKDKAHEQATKDRDKTREEDQKVNDQTPPPQ